MRAVRVRRAAPARRFCAANSQRSGEFSRGGSTPPRVFSPRVPAMELHGGLDCPPAAQQKAIEEAKALAEEYIIPGTRFPTGSGCLLRAVPRSGPIQRASPVVPGPPGWRCALFCRRRTRLHHASAAPGEAGGRYPCPARRAAVNLSHLVPIILLPNPFFKSIFLIK